MNLIWILMGVVFAVFFICMMIVIIKAGNGSLAEEAMNRNIEIMNKVMEKNKDKLKEMSQMGADISNKSIEMKAAAIKRGLSGDEIRDSKFCKHCGKTIDADSKFCNYCGKEQ